MHLPLILLGTLLLQGVYSICPKGSTTVAPTTTEATTVAPTTTEATTVAPTTTEATTNAPTTTEAAPPVPCNPTIAPTTTEATPPACLSLSPAVEDLRSVPAPWVHVFVDIKFTCNGRLIGWEYYAKKTGTFFADIWRPSSNGYDLVAKFAITTSNKGKQTFDIPAEDQIEVLPDDVIGIHYPKRNSRVVVPYQQGGKKVCCGVNAKELSQVVAERLWDPKLPVGKSLDKDIFSVYRLPALQPVLATKCPALNEHVQMLRDIPTEVGFAAYVDLKVKCGGVLTGWDFYASRPGTFYADILRRDSPGYKLIAKFLITTKQIGLQRFTIPAADRVQVQVNDIIGRHYPSNPGQAVIPVAAGSISRACCGINPKDMSHFMAQPALRDPSFPVNKTVDLTVTFRDTSLPALSPVIVP